MLVVIAANCGRCVRSAKFCVFVVQHAHIREECEEKLKVLILEMKDEIVEAQRQKAEGTLTPQAVEKSKKKGKKKGRKKAKQTKKKSKRK